MHETTKHDATKPRSHEATKHEATKHEATKHEATKHEPMKTSLLALALLALAADAPEATVRYRQSVMKTLAAQMTAMSLISKHEMTPSGERLILHAATAAEFSRDLEKLFPPSTRNIRSGALPKIWTSGADFAAHAKKLESETVKLESLARSGMTTAFGKQLEAVGAACKSCHDSYRQQD